MGCRLCNSWSEKLFNINSQYCNAKSTIKDDITEFLGHDVGSYLSPDDVVCSVCKTLLEDIVEIKNRLLDIILSPPHIKYPIKLGKYWDFLAKYALKNLEESDLDELITPSSMTPLSVAPNTRTSTPSQFWSVSHCKAYNQELEDNCARREMEKKKRSQSKASIYSSGNDEEVAKLFKGKKRRGRRPKSAGSLPKVITKNIRRVLSENGRSNSSLSDLSCLSYTRVRKRPRTPKLIYGNDNEIMRPRTRSINRMVFYCPDCLRAKKDLVMYTAHMIAVHNCKACYTCCDCGISFLTEDHLTIHRKIHYYSVMCTICGEKQDNVIDLQKHIDRHSQYSVSCPHCDLSFLSKYECNLHVFNRHRIKKLKVRQKPLYQIEEMCPYVSDNMSEKDSNPAKKECIEMILNIEERPKFYEKTFEDMDYQLRHPEPVQLVTGKTSLGDDLVVTQEDRYSNSRNSDSPSNVSSDTDGPLTDSTILSTTSISQRRKVRSSRTTRTEKSLRRDKDLSPSISEQLNRLDNSDSVNEDLPEPNNMSISDDEFSAHKRVPEIRDDDMRLGEVSDSSDISDSIQTEMNYIDGDIIHTNLTDFANTSATSSSNELNPTGVGVALDPDIADD